MKKGRVDYIVSGGGARNHTLMAMLAQRLSPLGCDLAASQDFGLPVDAKRPQLLRCWPGKPGIAFPPMSPQPREPRAR